MGGLDGEQKQWIKKLVNFRMKEGKKTRVRAIVYQTFHRPARTERDVIKLMVDALENIKPICEVVRVGIADLCCPWDCSQGSSTNLSYSLDP